MSAVTVQSGIKRREIGEVVDFAGSTAPAGWLLCFGQNVNRTTYAALFAVLSTTYGAGDGSTTFGLPDLRGRVIAGKDDMGGSAASRITSGGQAAINGSSLGAAGGAQDNTLDTTRIPAHAHGVNDSGHNHTQNSHNHTQDSHNHTQNSHNHTQDAHNHAIAKDTIVTSGTITAGSILAYVRDNPDDKDYRLSPTTGTPNVGVVGSTVATNQAATATNQATTATNQATTATNIANTTGITIQNAGGGGAHNNVQPTIVLNKMIYAGV